MTATATIEEAVCLRSVASTDFDLPAVIRDPFRFGHRLPGVGLVHQPSGIGSVGQMVQGALDGTPDDLHAVGTVSSEPDNPPGPCGTTAETGAENRIAVGSTVLLDGSQAPFPWDREGVDSASAEKGRHCGECRAMPCGSRPGRTAANRDRQWEPHDGRPARSTRPSPLGGRSTLRRLPQLEAVHPGPGAGRAHSPCPHRPSGGLASGHRCVLSR